MMSKLPNWIATGAGVVIPAASIDSDSCISRFALARLRWCIKKSVGGG